jgi:hypothetical protein
MAITAATGVVHAGEVLVVVGKPHATGGPVPE